MLCSVCKTDIRYDTRLNTEGHHYHVLNTYTLYTWSNGLLEVFLPPSDENDVIGNRVFWREFDNMPSLAYLDKLLLLK